MSSTSPRTSFDSTTTTSTVQRPLIQGGDSKSSTGSKIKSVFKKMKSHSEGPAEEGAAKKDKEKKESSPVPKSVKEGSFGGESSHMRMHM